MINKYKNISIIYGASGKECALKIDAELKRLHLDEFFPIRSYILANEILSSTSILDTVKSIIASSSACIVILTFDDMDGTRVRQNVLVEIGMALMLIDKENCFFISEKRSLPDDFPSDLQSVVNPNYFDKANIDEVVKKTTREIIRHLDIKNYRDILGDNNYIYDYKKVLDDIPLHIFEEKADVQLDHILDQWESGIRSFEFVVERIMYLIERIKFFPDFNSNERFFSFLSNIEAMICPTERDFEFYDKAYLINTCNFVSNILRYTRIKLNKQVIACLAAPSEHAQELRRHQIEFKEIADELHDFIEDFENGTFEYNWMLKIMAYEYAALAYMKYIACADRFDDSILSLMDYTISCYDKMIKTGKRNDPYSKILWQGYAQYDLTRAYENLYKVTNDEQYLSKMEEYSQASIVTRYRWFCENPFKGVFSNALSYEYFLVYKYEYELRYKYKKYSEYSTDEEILGGLDKLKGELNRYCEATGLGRLYDMRDGIDVLITNVKNKG
jgi:hypothetical protein